MLRFGNVIVFTLLTTKCSESKLPWFIRTCSRNRPDLSQCCEDSANHALPHVLEGVSELNLPPLRNLKVPKISGPSYFPYVFDFDGWLSNFKGAVFNESEFDLAKLVEYGKLHFPKLELQGRYQIYGFVGNTPVRGSGFANVILHGASLEAMWIFERYQVDGVDRLKVVSSPLVDHNMLTIEYQFANLFDGDRILEEKVNRFLNDNWDRVYRLNLSNINQSSCERDSLNLEPTNIGNCVSRGKSEHFDCRNHIRVIQSMGDGSRLYICGTNAHNPKDWVVNANLTHLSRNTFVPGIGMGIAKCPYDPADNSTAVWVEKGNPGDLPGLYSGTNAEFTKADTVIFRTDLHNLTTGRKEFTFKRTLKYDSKWLDKPNFVGSFEIGEFVLFFFRETAVEYINCGKSVYSRVARVCKKDTGGKNILAQNWATYLKARLNCSIPGEFPFYFNEIQSIYKVPGDDTRFYGTFTTSTNGLMGSAICSFTLDDIQAAFNGKFKEQASSSSAWLPVLSGRVPEPRPGTCVNDTETLPDTVLNFIRSHPLMDSAVMHESEKPVFFKRDLFFTRLVVDKIKVDIGGAILDYTVYYAGTNDGRVHKIVQWNKENEESSSILLDVFDVTPGEPIQVMELSKEHKALYVASDHRVKQIDLVMCNRRYDNCLRCVHDPYCGWDKDSNVCKPYSPGLLQDVSNSTIDVCDSSVVKKKMVVTWGQSLHLGCFLKMPAVLASQTITWYHYSKEKGRYKIVFRPDKYIETSEHGLVIIAVTEADAGRYDCWMGASLLCSYNVTVDAHRCSPPAKSNDYQKIYSDWCHEFEKYKSAMKTWERKQAQCSSRQNDSNQNSHPNEIYRPLV